MTNSSSNWEDALNDGLVNRLTRPLRQPRMMNMAMGQRIINRCDRFLTRLPLLSQQMQRWGNTKTLSYDAVPIVYAQPISLTKEQNLENRGQDSQPIVSPNQPSDTIIQRKLDSSQSLATRTVNNPIPVQNSTDLSTDLSNYNVGDETTQFLTLETQINQSSISAPEIPVVSPQPISEKLPKSAEMGLRGLTQSPTSSPNISELNISHPEQQISEIPVVSPQPISEQLPKSAEMGLRGLTQSPTSSPNISELNINHSSQQQIPVVSPQPISEQLPKSAEMGLTGLTQSPTSSPNISELNINHSSQQQIPEVSPQPILDTPLPIIQAKIQNYSASQSSLPIVNNLNTLVEQQQTPQNNYLENFRGINHEKLISQVASKALPIVTAQNLKSEPSVNNTEISLAINSPNYQNQPATLINTQPVNISKSRINQTNNEQNFSPLPVVTVNFPSNSSLKAQSSPLPLAKTTPSSRSNSQQPNLSNRNSISNTDSSSTTRSFASSLSPTETSVSPASSRNIDIDVNAIASQVERKLMRKLVIESERRGKIR